MDFKEKSIELYALILKDLVSAMAQLNPEAIKYVSFTGGLIEELGIYDEVLQRLTTKMNEEEIKQFVKFEEQFEDWLNGEEVKRDE